MTSLSFWNDLYVQEQDRVHIMVFSGDIIHHSVEGRICWIADKSEFTPKTIQTKDERVNLVYAIKIHVINDGYLKIGTYGKVKFS